MEECANCSFFNDNGCCECPHADKWYACPIENKKPENIEALKEYAEWNSEKGGGRMTKEERAIAYFEGLKKVLVEDFLKHLPKDTVGYYATLLEKEYYDTALKALRNSKKPSGRWIPTGYDGYADGNPVYDIWECSNCGWEHNGELNSLTAFCPNCGFEMEVSNEDKPIMHYEDLWDRLYNWLYDMRFSIAPDETVTDDHERKVRSIQVDLLDEIMEWMTDQVPKADGGGE